MSRALSRRTARLAALILTVVLLSVLMASAGHAHWGHTYHANSIPTADSPTSQSGKVARADTSPQVDTVSPTTLLNPRASDSSGDVARQVVWARSAGVRSCGSACGEGCADCHCGSCLGTCSSGNACSTACASMHGAIVSQETNAFGLFEVLRFLLPVADRTSGRTLSPEPPPPKS